jgi:hypothetical protein
MKFEIHITLGNIVLNDYKALLTKREDSTLQGSPCFRILWKLMNQTKALTRGLHWGGVRAKATSVHLLKVRQLSLPRRVDNKLLTRERHTHLLTYKQVQESKYGIQERSKWLKLKYPLLGGEGSGRCGSFRGRTNGFWGRWMDPKNWR